MYSGFITAKRVVPLAGVHQRFDTVAYRLVRPYLAQGGFPALKTILNFEGMNGPDGVKAKSPLDAGPSHLYDPVADTGALPELIAKHYTNLVAQIQAADLVRAGFEAAWLAHYVCDGMTPAHHFPLEERLSEQTTPESRRKRYTQPVLVRGTTPADGLRRSWAIWGGKGLLTTHFNFEIGVATALIGHSIRVTLDERQLASARALGPVEFFKAEARDIARLELYDLFYAEGWNAKVVRLVKTRLVPQTVQAIATIWLLAYLEAGYEMAKAAA